MAKNTGRHKVEDEETIWNQEVWLASVGLLYWKYLVSTFVTTKFNRVAGRMVVQHPALTWQSSSPYQFRAGALAATIDGLLFWEPRHEREFEGPKSYR